MKKSLRVYIAVLISAITLLVPVIASSKTVKVVVLPWKVNAADNLDFVKNAVADMLTSRLGANASVEVIRPEEVKASAGAKTDSNDSLAAEAGKKLKADYVLYGSLTVLGSSVSLDAKLLNVKEGKTKAFYSKGETLNSIIGLADRLANDALAASGVAVAQSPQAQTGAAPPSNGPVSIKSGVREVAPPSAPPVTVIAPASGPSVSAAPPAPGAPAVPAPVIPIVAAPQGATAQGDSFIIKPKEEEKGPADWKSRAFDGLFKAVAAADLNMDGEKEIFLLSAKSLFIARVKNGGLEIVKEIKDEKGAENVALSAIDTDRDGAAELYVSRIYNERPDSVLVEYADNDYKIAATSFNWLLRTVSVDKNEPVLVGQGFRRGDGFYGPLHVLEKKGSTISDKGLFEVKLPRDTDIYRFDVFDFTGDGNSDLLALDERGYLRVYKKDGKGGWEQAFKSVDYYGGTLNYIRLSEDRPGVAEPEPVAVEGGLFHADLDKDGKTELILRKNKPTGIGRALARPWSFKSSEIVSLEWDELGANNITESWRTKEAAGYLSGFLIEDLDGDGALEVIMLLVEGTEKLTGIPKSYILSQGLSL